jgi:hypothetical protein
MAQDTLAQRMVKLERMKTSLMDMDNSAANENGTWSDTQWDAHNTEYKQIEDCIFNAEHTPLMCC